MKKYYKPIQNHFDPNFIGCILEWRGENKGRNRFFYKDSERNYVLQIENMEEYFRGVKNYKIVFEISAAEASLLLGEI